MQNVQDMMRQMEMMNQADLPEEIEDYEPEETEDNE
jgi:hypothetical protein